MIDDQHILERLADGRFYSGATLAKAIGVSRMSVWKSIQRLKESGVGIEAHRGRGYRLSYPVELMSSTRILDALSEAIRAQIAELEVLRSIDSTNRYLLRKQDAQHGQVCIAEHQSQGRGRRERTWVSPFGANLYLSLFWRIDEVTANLSCLSLAASVALAQALETLGVSGQGIKWPNDLYVQGKKLGGILLEMTGEPGGPCQLVIGIGLNINMPASHASDIDQDWTDLSRALSTQQLSRNQVAAKVLDALIRTLVAFQASGFTPFEAAWRDFDLATGKDVDLLLGGQRLRGLARGIDDTGRLLLEIEGRTRAFASGEVSLRLPT